MKNLQDRSDKDILSDILALEQQGHIEQALSLGKTLLSKYHSPTTPFALLAPLLIALTRLAGKLNSPECLYFADIALKRRTKTREEQPRIVKILINKAIYLRRIGDIEGSLDTYDEIERYIARSPKEQQASLQAFVYSGKAQCIALSSRKGNLQEAEHLFLRSMDYAKSIGRDYPSNTLELANLYLDQQYPTKAIPLIEHILERYHIPANAHINIHDLHQSDSIEYWKLAQNMKLQCLIMQGDFLEAMNTLLSTTQIAAQYTPHSLTVEISIFYTLCTEIGYFESIYSVQEICGWLLDIFPFTLVENRKFILLSFALKAAIRENNLDRITQYEQMLNKVTTTSLPSIHIYNLDVIKIEILLKKKRNDEARIALQKFETTHAATLDIFKIILHELHAACVALDISIPYFQRYERIQWHWAEADKVIIDMRNKLFRREMYMRRLLALENLGAPPEIKEVIQQCIAEINMSFSIPKEQEEESFQHSISNFKLIIYEFAQKQWGKCIEELQQKISQQENAIVNSRRQILEHQQIEQKIITVLEHLIAESIEKDWSSKLMQKNIISLINEVKSSVLLNTELTPRPSLPTVNKALRNALLSRSSALSDKEILYCQLILQGKDINYIMEALQLQESTMTKFRYRISRKLNLPAGEKLLHYLSKLSENLFT